MIRLAVFDIDRTLIPPETGLIAPETEAALRHLQSRGIKTVIASGRMLNFLQPELLALDFDYYILSNGTCLADAQGNYLFRRTMDPGTVERLTAEVIRRGWAMDVRYEEGLSSANPAITVPEQMAPFWARFNFAKKKEPKALRARIAPPAGSLPVSCSAYIPPENLPEMEKLFPELDFLPVFESPLCDINPKGVSKASALAELCRILQIPMEDTVAFGDDRNDLELIAAAGVGVAMGEAIACVKEAADEITETSLELGVVRALRRLGLLDEKENK